ncbi:TetR/AcrR family transcriptional regulator C-terminal domain-containing protein [Kitasatospora sp. NPDC051853]|uniref:TetR/AcrR family transcriptional regulator C-terminal domain-containing protein n=1 Tax=Kitasatospora sp. NPDC051853 TaxID=3364058 RepID=UPI0037A18023
MAGAVRREPLNRGRVLATAVQLADAIGIEALSMRRLAQELGVVPMALYKHVANKDQLLDGMVDAVLAEIDPVGDGPWREVVRARVLSARAALLRHRWAARVIETRPVPTAAVLAYLDSMAGAFRSGGLSVQLTHHVMHAMGSRLLGFSQELFEASGAGAPAPEFAAAFPRLAELASGGHDEASVVGGGCDDRFEFEFALDLLLDGFARLHGAGWAPPAGG